MKRKENISWLDATKLVLNSVKEPMCQTQILQKISQLGLKDTKVNNSSEVMLRTLLSNSTGSNSILCKVEDQKFIINPDYKSIPLMRDRSYAGRRQLPQRKKTKTMSDDFVNSDSLKHSKEEKISYSPYTSHIDHLRKNKRIRTKPVTTPKTPPKPVIVLKESVNAGAQPSSSSRNTIQDMLNNSSDIMKYDVIAKKSVTMDEFLSMSKCQQRYLASLLPYSDIRRERNAVRLLPVALTNTFFSSFFRDWQDRLCKGELSTDFKSKVKAELEKQVAKDPWKEKFFEDVWGFSRTESRETMKYLHTLSDNDGFDAKIRESLSQVPVTFSASAPTAIHDPIIESLTPPTSDGSEHDRSHVPNTSDLDNLPATPEKSLRPYDNILTPDHDADHEKSAIEVGEAPSLKIADELPFDGTKSPPFTESVPNKTSTPRTSNSSSETPLLSPKPDLSLGIPESPKRPQSPDTIETPSEVVISSPKILDTSITPTKSQSELETSAETVVSSIDGDGTKFLKDIAVVIKNKKVSDEEETPLNDDILNSPDQVREEKSRGSGIEGSSNYDIDGSSNYDNKSPDHLSPDHDLVCDFIDEDKEIHQTDDSNSVDTHANDQQELDDSSEKVNKLAISDDISPNIMDDFPKEPSPKSPSPKRERITLKILKKNLILPAVNPIPISTAASSTPTPALTTTVSLKPTIVQVSKSSRHDKQDAPSLRIPEGVKQSEDRCADEGVSTCSTLSTAVSPTAKTGDADDAMPSPKLNLSPALLSPGFEIVSSLPDPNLNDQKYQSLVTKDERKVNITKPMNILSTTFVQNSSKGAPSRSLLHSKNCYELKPTSPKMSLTPPSTVSPKLSLSQNMTSPKRVPAQNMVSPTLTMPQTIASNVSANLSSVSPKLTMSQIITSPKLTPSYNVISPKLSILHKAASPKVSMSPKISLSPKVSSSQSVTKANVTHCTTKVVSNIVHNATVGSKQGDVTPVTKSVSSEVSVYQKQGSTSMEPENMAKQRSENVNLVKQTLPGITSIPAMSKAPFPNPTEGDTRPRKRAKMDYNVPSSALALQQPFGRRDDNKLVFLKENESDEELSLKRISLQQQLLAEKGIKTSSPIKSFGKEAAAPGSKLLQTTADCSSPSSSSSTAKDKNTSTPGHLKVENGGTSRHDNSESIRSALKAKINQRKYTDINLDLPPPRYTPLMNSNHKCYVAQGCPGECVCSTAPMLFCTKCYHLSHSSCSNVLCSNCGALFKFG